MDLSLAKPPHTRRQGSLSFLVGSLGQGHSNGVSITAHGVNTPKEETEMSSIPNTSALALAHDASSTESTRFSTSSRQPHEPDKGTGSLNSKLNWLRAAVLGANVDRSSLLIAGLAAGALSMAGGEYVSVSSQRDIEKTVMAKEAAELRDFPDEELEELTEIYTEKGLSRGTARQVALELTAHDPLRAHAEAELGLDPDEYTNPWYAAFASMAAFTVGALVPLLVMVCSPTATRVYITIAATIVGLFLTGLGSALASGSGKTRPVARNIIVGICSMAITYLIGHLVGTRV
ncbi:VIT family protein [Cutibacterium acnes]|uniref:VIT1/CCC1 transporter family protein n=1 Tax=Cutibacterium acnes TaxID=1747 RepID=UPI001C0FA5F9|nr:VIT family protein [Cutibacterium acnes]MBU5171297.1 VIT family protein [Cutibacterium acnes]MCD1048409.1 VIT family protein [Cutibacterium acnes]MCD1077122.1 VIT family protein [Cutibacterium acnes]MCD1097375.1 VIT family protein [Cutibacterium acnes]MCD1114176.1 VIT family protein [Cutibacterium acnes]